ncbi:MAG TPA: DUF2844 domain-containing protein [Terriglobia bacterium]|nr:DUF2844 domain-containing protein [Terriglobia bacterium]
MKTALAVLASMFLLAAPSWAVLGQPVQSVHSDQMRLHGQLRSVSRRGYSIQQITAADGTVIKEYVSPAGVVFGVSWQGAAMPNLSQLLGSYFQQFQQVSRSAAHRRQALVVRTDQLVVESGGHMRAFRGRAYAPALLPNNLTPAVVK